MPPSQPDPMMAQIPALRAIARALALPHDADDHVQDTLVAALSQSKRVGRSGAWFRRVLLNNLRMSYRRARRWERVIVGIPEGVPPRALDEHAVLAELLEQLGDALANLDEPYRSVVHQRFFEDRKTAEIAAANGCPHGTVRWQLHEGLRRMRMDLDQRFGGRSAWRAAALGSVPTRAGWGLELSLGLAVVAAGVLALADVHDVESVAIDSALSHREENGLIPAAVAATVRGPRSPTQPFRGTTTPEETELENPRCQSLPLRKAVDHCIEQMNPGLAHEKLEIELRLVGGPQDVGNLVELVRATQGRSVPCFGDGASHEHEDVVELSELSACIEEVLDIAMFDPLDPGEEARFDGVRNAEPTEALPEPDLPTAGVDPQEAIRYFGLPRNGSATANVAIVECGDYDCPFSDRARVTLDELITRYPQDIALYFLHSPLPMHPGATMAARAAEAARNQGHFWAMHEALFDDHRLREEDELVDKATELGLEPQRFREDLLSAEVGARIAAQQEVCAAAGGQSSPNFFVGDDLVVGAQDIDTFVEVARLEGSNPVRE